MYSFEPLVAWRETPSQYCASSSAVDRVHRLHFVEVLAVGLDRRFLRGPLRCSCLPRILLRLHNGLRVCPSFCSGILRALELRAGVRADGIAHRTVALVVVAALLGMDGKLVLQFGGDLLLPSEVLSGGRRGLNLRHAQLVLQFDLVLLQRDRLSLILDAPSGGVCAPARPAMA